MIKIIDDFLTDEEFSFFRNMISDKDFYADSKAFIRRDYTSYYNRKFVSLPENIENRIYQSFKTECNIDNIKIDATWINHIYVNTNENDGFHKDISDFSLVLFLNEGFKGGNFEYKDDNNDIKIIEPKENKAVLMDINRPHRVRNVTEGNRYSFITFLSIMKKTKKTII